MGGTPKSTSPDGRYAIHVEIFEMRMSHWVESPILSDAQSGEVLLRFANSLWSLNTTQWQDDAVVRLSLRKYPGDHTPSSFEAVIDCAARKATVQGAAVEGLTQVEAALERLYEAGRRR
ncbi:MAG TPA: hypothetical protein VGN52_24545 [Burkholderiales bacterium]|jgi:hypothetical protein